MSLNDFRDEARDFLNTIGKSDEPISIKLNLLEKEMELLKASLQDPDKFAHQVYDMLFILFELAAQQGIDLDRQWKIGRKRKTMKYIIADRSDSINT